MGSGTTDRGVGSLAKAMAGLAQAITPPSTSPTKMSPSASPAPGTSALPSAPTDAPADLAPTASPSTADPDAAPTPAAASAIPDAATATPDATPAASTDATDPVTPPTDSPASTDAAAASAAPPAYAPAPNTATSHDTEEGYSARLQAEALARANRMQSHNALQQEHPHMFMMADYLKNFATTINPKAGTLPAEARPGAPGAPGAATAAALAAPAAVPHPPVKFDNLPQMNSFVAVKSDPTAQPALHTGLAPNAPERQGSAAIASMIEEIQARVEALTAAHLNVARNAAGLPLLPVFTNGHPYNLPPITSAAAIDNMSDEDLASWADYYLGDSQGATLDRATMVTAVKASIGISGA